MKKTFPNLVGLSVGGRNGKVGMSQKPDGDVTAFHTHTRQPGPIEWHSPDDLNEIYRFTWLRSRDHPIIIRIEKQDCKYMLC
ncbi:MAG: hypothetical protein FWF70_07760 [Bacteroidetes bacterium]|nr:hypothetical protein [Bacteroidota bacterium]MCL1968122.1 hypothetical protein [Bacteroidota bacterium]